VNSLLISIIIILVSLVISSSYGLEVSDKNSSDLDTDWINPDTGLFQPPLKMVKYGITPQEVVCNGKLVKLYKPHQDVPVCIKLSTSEKLTERGWRTIISATSQPTKSTQPEKSTTPLTLQDCSGSAGCFTDYVTRIVDGDTIYTDTLKIRLSLTNTPEINQAGYSQATQFTEKLCPVGSRILVDQDDLQPVDKYGRVLAKVYCGDKVLNSELLYNGYANILTQYCSTSEFTGEAWAQKYGCETKTQELKQQIPKESQTPTPAKENQCDPSYPDVCIPPYPPDLDCGDIPYKNFRVLPPDPHRFDGDKDGIGCER